MLMTYFIVIFCLKITHCSFRSFFF